MGTGTENDCSDTRVGEQKVGSQIQQLYHRQLGPACLSVVDSTNWSVLLAAKKKKF
jgi:hypothetical protein